MAVTFYTRMYCAYCWRAKQLFDQLGVAYREIKVDHDATALEEMKEKSGQHTVPQIWIGETHVGGCDELMSLHRSGKLLDMLAQAQ